MAGSLLALDLECLSTSPGTVTKETGKSVDWPRGTLDVEEFHECVLVIDAARDGLLGLSKHLGGWVVEERVGMDKIGR